MTIVMRKPSRRGRSVVLVTCGARADEHQIGDVAERGEHGTVASAAKWSRSAVDGGGAVRAGDHAHEHPGASAAVRGVGTGKASATDTGSRGSGCKRRMTPGSWHGDLGRSGRRWGTLVRMTDAPTWTAIRTCPFCEAGCGLEITLRGEQIVRVRGDRVTCSATASSAPRGRRSKQSHEDPDRLRRPLVKRDGEFIGVSAGGSLRRDRAEAGADHRGPRA